MPHEGDGWITGSRTRRRAATMAAVVVVLAAASRSTPAQRAAGPSGVAEPSEAELAKTSQNPVANLISLPLQYNFYTAGGLGQNTELVLNVQPVLPLAIGENWFLLSRTIVPFVSVPVVTDLREKGIADIQEQAYFTAKKPGKITWGLGPIFSFPVATNVLTRTGQWGLGPTAVALVTPDRWVIGVLANNVWRIGGAAHGEILNVFTTQPFINFNLAHAWTITTSPVITANWSAPSGEKWTVPVGIGVSRVTHIGSQAMSFSLQYYHNVNHPSAAGSEQVRLQASFLWPVAGPKAVAK
jgi:hypothetical protein